MDNRASFTPGPWVPEAVVDGSRDCMITFGRFCIASVHNAVDFPQMIMDKAPFQQAANAHLIAAAPELYEALTLAARYLDPRRYADAVRRIDVILAKARGEQAGVSDSQPRFAYTVCPRCGCKSPLPGPKVHFDGCTSQGDIE